MKLAAPIALLLSGVAAAQPAPPATFDGLVAASTPIDAQALTGLIWSTLGDCAGLTDDLHLRQCRGVRAARGRDAANQTFLFKPGRGAVWIGSADAERGGVAFGLRGCLACEEPVDLGDGQPRFVVTRGSLHVAQSHLVAPDLTHGTVPFTDPSAAARWRETPDRVRAEIVFRIGKPGQETWSEDGLQGVFVELVGFRLTDACDGTVLAANPPSPVGPIDASACGAGHGQPSLVADDEIPDQLNASQIRETLKPAGADVNVCFDSFGVPGKADAFLDVASDGHVKYAEVRGELADTPTSKCIVAALKKVRFPKFRRTNMQIHYPFILR